MIDYTGVRLLNEQEAKNKKQETKNKKQLSVIPIAIGTA
jgi:hypothetical protein